MNLVNGYLMNISKIKNKNKKLIHKTKNENAMFSYWISNCHYFMYMYWNVLFWNIRIYRVVLLTTKTISFFYLMFTVPLITAKYRVNPENSVEEKLFNNEDNPSPLLELVGQELAMQTSGIVKVYIDTLGDISRIRNVLKVSNTFFSLHPL